MSGHPTYQPQNAFMRWMERRLPIAGLVYSSFVVYPTPRNLNYWWTFGGILAFMLGVQIVTGIVLAMHYTPHVDFAFNSVEQIMRDVNYGWLLRYLHANGASMFFLAAYIHMFRGMYYGSYKEPREVLWILGVILLLLMIMTGFMGYVLPWGQMSFWAATVITNLFSAIPLVGEADRHLAVGRLCGRQSDAQPVLLAALPAAVRHRRRGRAAHLGAAHGRAEQSRPASSRKTEQDTVAFTPYATIKDGFLLMVFCILFAWFVFYIPNFLGHPDNYIPANPAVTPTHIVPEWYYLPFYAILRAIPNKLLGVVALGASIVILAFLPWLDTSKVRSARYRPLYRQFFWLFVIVCIGLGWLGSKPPEGNYVLFARIFTAYYFAYFLIILPLLGRIEKPKPVPSSIAESVLREGVPIGRRRRRRRREGLRTGSHGRAAHRPGTRSRGAVVGSLALGAAHAHADTPVPPKLKWSFAGPFGKFDRAQLQRGFKVYREVCQVCHGITLLSFRNLAEPGGPGFTTAQAAAIAAEYQVKGEPDDQGEVKDRPGRLADRFPPPFPNEQAARARYNAVPPDMSVIAKARGYERGFPWWVLDMFTQYQEHGVDYLVALMQGYEDKAPAGVNVPPGTFYNKYYPGHTLAMPPPLSDKRVDYTDGAPTTVEQYSKDVAAFLAWAAEPHLEARKRIGFQVMIFLLVFAGLLYFTKKKVWRQVELHPEELKPRPPTEYPRS